jgi:hypothetical protein
LHERLARGGPRVVAAQHDVRKSVDELTELFAA